MQPVDNPYAAPTTHEAAPAPLAGSLPIFCRVMFVMDLVFCVIRVPLLGVSVVGASTIPVGDRMADIVWGEVLTSVCITLFGLIANILLLQKSRVGLLLAALSLAAVLASVATGVWQGILLTGDFGMPDRVRYLRICLLIGMVVLRLCMNGVYVIALARFALWSTRHTNIHQPSHCGSDTI